MKPNENDTKLNSFRVGKQRKTFRDQVKEEIQTTKYFYFRDKNFAPRITVCSIQYKDKWYKGVSFCSFLDVINKKRGREIAFGRAIMAVMLNRPYYYDGPNIQALKAVNLRVLQLNTLLNNYIIFPLPKSDS